MPVVNDFQRGFGAVALLALALFLPSGCGDRPGSPSSTGASPDSSPVVVKHDDINWEGIDTDGASGQIVYVPAYSSVYHLEGRTYDLAVTLSVHNVSLEHPIQLVRVYYYDTDGNQVRKYLDQPAVLRPLQTMQFLVKQSDISGGTGAKFIVQWISKAPVVSPIVEAVMICTSSQQGLSFSCQGKVIHELGDGN